MRTHVRTQRSERSGMTLVEVVLGLSLFVAFASSAFLALEASSRSFRTETSVAHLDFLARKALDDVSEHLRAADFDGFLPPPVAPPAARPRSTSRPRAASPTAR